MASIRLDEVDGIVERLEHLIKKTGPHASIVGTIRIEDLGIDLGFNNRDCTGSCNTSCSGCSACSGCSGCSSTSTSTSFDPGATVSLPDPLDRLVANLRDPKVQAVIAQAARSAGGG
jgi:hypothetical protein